jgi:predicted phage baseplate assembly protein
MIPLSAPIDDIDFDALVEIARSNLPTLAPEWTDYNYSDPGITLIELLSWIADSQIYSIGRDRADERAQMASLLGIASEGAHPAVGELYPPDGIGAHQTIPADTRVTPVGTCAPRLEVAVATPLWPVEIAAITVETEGGSVDHTATNAQPRASYAPFGDPPSSDAVLRVALAGTLDAGMVSVSLGFELEEDAADGRDALGGVEITCLAPDGGEDEVAVETDTTDGMRNSGVMILRFPAVTGAGAEQVLLFRSAKDALVPRLLRISTNAIPVAQRATLAPPPFAGTGRPGQKVEIEPLSLFAADEAAEGEVWRLVQREAGLALDVRVQEGGQARLWTPGELRNAGPEDERYELTEQADGSRIEILFGNGINGRRPPLDAQILIGMVLSAGAGGNIASGIEWKLDGYRISWVNREASTGGKDADDLADRLARLRIRLRDERTLATSAQIEAAALDLSNAYGVKRATIVEGWEPGRRRPASAATRTLLVTRKGEGPETEDWRRAIARELSPRIALTERFLVASPVWRELRVRVRAVAVAGRVPAAVAEDIRNELADRLLPSGSKGENWPLGQDVTAMAVGGWIRRLPGVAAVTELALLDASGRSIEGGNLALACNELPLLVAQADDVRVDAGSVR